jgi:hypothetical protein
LKDKGGGLLKPTAPLMESMGNVSAVDDDCPPRGAKTCPVGGGVECESRILFSTMSTSDLDLEEQKRAVL